MNEPVNVEECDALLLPLLQTRDSSTTDVLLVQLIQEHADPIIEKIVRRKLGVSLNRAQETQSNQDAQELASGIRTTLIGDLRALQTAPDVRSIISFRDYVAIKTYSACADHFRQKNPRRARLKDSLRHQLKENPRFALWKADDGHWYASFQGRNLTGATGGGSGSAPTVDAVRELFPRRPIYDLPPAVLLNAIFKLAERPIRFELLIALVAELWSIADTPAGSVDDLELGPTDTVPGVDIRLEQRLFLERLWSEVCELPVLQRAALLLNLRDVQFGSVIFFLPHLGIASRRRIAEALELPEAEFRSLWNDLPLDDTTIAARMGVTRQQVINLRKTARERLRRRLEKTGSEQKDAPVSSKKTR
jgi:DNA-directed RNA polymerase specialized sigma24 family protein